MLCRHTVSTVSDIEGESDEARDAARWEAVEEATELLVDGDQRAALAHLRGVLETDPGNGYAYHYVGTAFFELEELVPARDAYRAAIAAFPHHLGARVALVHCLRLLNETADAVIQANAALELFPEDADATFALALALAARGQRKDAVRVFKRFLARSPEVEVQLETQGIIDMLHQEPEGVPFVWKP